MKRCLQNLKLMHQDRRTKRKSKRKLVKSCDEQLSHSGKSKLTNTQRPLISLIIIEIQR